MTHVPLLIEKSQLPAEHHGIYDTISVTRGGVTELFGLLLHDPKLADRIAQLGQQIRFESSLPEDVREIVILTVAAELPGSYFWHSHMPLARAAGVSEKLIGDIQAKRSSEGKDADLLAYVRNVVGCRRQESALRNTLLKRFGTVGLITLTATISYYMMLISTMAAFELTDEIARLCDRDQNVTSAKSLR